MTLISIDIVSTGWKSFLQPGYLLILILGIMMLLSFITTLLSLRLITKGILAKGLTAIRSYVKVLYFRVLIEKLIYTIAIGILYLIGLMKISQENYKLMTIWETFTASSVIDIIYIALLGWMLIDHINRLSGWRKRANDIRSNVLYLITAQETDNLLKTKQYKNKSKLSIFINGATEQLDTQVSKLVKGKIEIMGHIRLDNFGHMIKFRLTIVVFIIFVFSLK